MAHTHYYGPEAPPCPNPDNCPLKMAPWSNPEMRWVCEDHPTEEQGHKFYWWLPFRCYGAGMPDPAKFDNLGQPLFTNNQ